jgi:Holliday junction resolvase RusA-like endonuclease
MSEWVLVLPLRAPLMTLNMQRRAHWSEVAKAKADTALVVTAAAKKAKLPPIDELVSIRLVWFAPDARRRDVDGLAPMMKSILDCLVQRKVLVDDSSKYVWEAKLGPIVVDRTAPRFEVRIRSVEAGVGVFDGRPGTVLP